MAKNRIYECNGGHMVYTVMLAMGVKEGLTEETYLFLKLLMAKADPLNVAVNRNVSTALRENLL
jgi:hypothetical protein